jgi:hypothetical protein
MTAPAAVDLADLEERKRELEREVAELLRVNAGLAAELDEVQSIDYRRRRLVVSGSDAGSAGCFATGVRVESWCRGGLDTPAPEMGAPPLKPRVLGGFLVVPTANTIRSIHRPAERARLIRLVLETLREAEGDVLEARGDTVLELRRRHSKWITIGHHFGICMQMAFRIGAERRAQLDEPPTGDVRTAEVLRDAA